DQVREMLNAGGPSDLRQRLDMAESELALVTRLDAIRQRRTAMVAIRFSSSTAERDYAAALSEAGFGSVGDDEESAANHIRASAVAGAVLAALDDWAIVAEDTKSKAWLFGVTRRIAPSEWGDRIRAAVFRRDQLALQALARDALRDGRSPLDDLSP